MVYINSDDGFFRFIKTFRETDHTQTLDYYNKRKDFKIATLKIILTEMVTS